MRKSILALFLISFIVPAHAAKAWKSGETKDDEGNVICVYAYKLGHIYVGADEFMGICPIAIDVD